MGHIKKYILAFSALFTTLCGLCQVPFSERNVSYNYTVNGELMLNHLIAFSDNDSFDLKFTISLNKALEVNFDSIYDIHLYYKEDYKTGNALDSVKLSMPQVLKNFREKDYYFRHRGNNNVDAGLLELHIINKTKDREYVFDINLNEDFEYGNDGLMKFSAEGNYPLMQNFILQNDPFLIEDEKRDSSELWVYVYKSDFDIAVPPMIVDYKGATKTLSVQELFKIHSDSILQLSAPGLYFVQKDTSSLMGLGFRIEEKPFPKLGTYETLTQPLKYISTKTEYEEFEDGTNLDNKFQSFWISKAESEEDAKRSIKNFYSKVAEANFFFTGYKEGWKTDMGMIYIIYGAPDRVFRHEEYEEWVYRQSINLPALRFTFVKIKNVFSDNHYTLVRDKKFDKHWFRAVELWRTGKK